jgi:tRNA nucleotidyltransferase/poly(A) polymerase
MRDLWSIASSDKIISKISKAFTKNTFLVGGCVRDILMKRPSRDYDIVTFDDAWGLAQKIAKTLGAKAFWIDRKREVARIAFSGSNGQTLIDISAPKGPDIISDLKARDITINAIALDLQNKKLIDPLHGAADLQSRIIRSTSEANLISDPLRILRCARFAVELGFTIEPKTYKLLKKHSSLLSSCAPERIRQELMTGLNCENGAKMFLLMHETNLISPIFHFKKQSSFPVATKINHLIEQRESYLPGIENYFYQEIESGITRSGLLRFGAFLIDNHALSLEKIRKICRGLKFSNRSGKIVAMMLNSSISLAKFKDDIKKKPYHFISTTEDVLPEILLLCLADSDNLSRNIPMAKNIWDYYVNIFKPRDKTPLLSGDEIMNMLNCTPGPKVGKLLARIEQARIEGSLSSKQDAIRYLHTIKGGI